MQEACKAQGPATDRLDFLLAACRARGTSRHPTPGMPTHQTRRRREVSYAIAEGLPSSGRSQSACRTGATCRRHFTVRPGRRKQAVKACPAACLPCGVRHAVTAFRGSLVLCTGRRALLLTRAADGLHTLMVSQVPHPHCVVLCQRDDLADRAAGRKQAGLALRVLQCDQGMARIQLCNKLAQQWRSCMLGCPSDSPPAPACHLALFIRHQELRHARSMPRQLPNRLVHVALRLPEQHAALHTATEVWMGR